MEEEAELLPQLDLISTIGFQGKIRNGLIVHPDRNHIIYCLGQTVLIKDICRNKQYYLRGHSNTVSCLAISKDGSLLASGQVNYMGFKADVIIWDFKNKEQYGCHKVHKVKVEAVTFSCKSNYVISLGGQDCRSVVVWCVNKKEPLCGSPACQIMMGYAITIRSANLINDIFVTGGNDFTKFGLDGPDLKHSEIFKSITPLEKCFDNIKMDSLRVWKLDPVNRKIIPVNVPLGPIKREIVCLEIDKNDTYLYCGTSSGDILKVRLSLDISDGVTTSYNSKLAHCLSRTVDKKIKGDSPLYSLGVTALCMLKTGDIILGTGAGILCRAVEKQIQTTAKLYQIVTNAAPSVNPSKLKTEIQLVESQKAKVMGAVSSIALRGDGHQIFVGTRTCEIYRIALPEFVCELLYTCHNAPVNDVVFPFQCSELFATSSTEHVRVWNTETNQELLRITVPNMICSSVFFMRDGRTIITGWNDGKIRAFTPETGKLLYIIHDAHQRGVTAIATTSNCKQIISGGGEGEVRVWDVNPVVQVLRATMKEHKGAVTSVCVKSNDLECATSSADGSCIVWDLKRYIRSQVMFANSLFRCICYGPDECQIITCGTDRKISYWEVFDASQIRELDGSMSGAVNAMDISDDKQIFISGGCDKLVKVWRYQEGIVTHVGIGHGDEITALRISPNKQHIVTVSKDGSILCWRFPKL